MPLATWFRPPRRTLTVFLGLIAVLATAMAWLAWQVIEGDRAVERSQVQDRVDLGADHVTTALQQSLADLDRRLAADADRASPAIPDGVVFLHASRDAIVARPRARLLFQPAMSPVDEAPAAVFEAGEALEFRDGNPTTAARVYETLARSSNPAVRAGALVRLARVLRKCGRTQAALDAYAALAELGSTPRLGLPAELAASVGRGTVVEALGRRDDLVHVANDMADALWAGQYLLLRPVWESHVEMVSRWGADAQRSPVERQALAVSAGAQWVYDQWSARAFGGRRAKLLENQPTLVSWTATADRLDAALAGPTYIARVWSQATRDQLAPPVAAGLIDTEGHVAAGVVRKEGVRATRAADATGLPWTVQVAMGDSVSQRSPFAARRRPLLGGITVLALVLIAGSYFITRSIARELAVARLQSEFVATVSHEFRTPLTAIRQLSELLARGRVFSDDRRQQSYEILFNESERLQRLVESLLDFGRIEAGAFQYRFEILDAAGLVADTVAAFRETVSAAGFDVDLQASEGTMSIRGDREALGLALRNLLDNAAKYSRECRTIWVEAARLAGSVAIGVRDRGIGIPPAEQRAIFDRFVRGTAGRDAGIRGTGIGLALARRIVEAHRGDIRVHSTPGEGSTFTVVLPLESTE